MTISCDDGDGVEDEPARVEAPLTEPADTARAPDVTLLPEIPAGSPMPEASRASGIPPYPGAIVHTRAPRERPGLASFEAFTPDPWEVVEAHYDTVLGREWTKVDAEDTRVYQKENDRAAITLSPWEPDDLPDDGDHPAVLRNARTIIGAAWRTDSP